jgi:hypothetical protein
VHPFGKAFGNGALDAVCFQPCDASERDLPATCLVRESEGDARVHDAALGWLDRTLASEVGIVPEDDATREVSARYAARLSHVAEDLVVLRRGAGSGVICAVHVRAPSGWRPERALGASLTLLHEHVPELSSRASGEILTRMMIDRGPYVRFVWGVSTSAALDHHPHRMKKPPWEQAQDAFLRVERQLTIPLREVDAALFLIRVYVYGSNVLPHTTREALVRALSALPNAFRAYKGLPEDMRLVTRFFGR